MRLFRNFCPVCPRDERGAQRELTLEDGTKCHGCGFEMQVASFGLPAEFYRCDEPCGAQLYWKPGGKWNADGEPPHAEVTCLECGYIGFRYRPGGK